MIIFNLDHTRWPDKYESYSRLCQGIVNRDCYIKMKLKLEKEVTRNSIHASDTSLNFKDGQPHRRAAVLNAWPCGPEFKPFGARGSDLTTKPKHEDFHRTMDFLGLFHTNFNFQQLLFMAMPKNHFLDHICTNKDLPYNFFTKDM